MKPGPKELVTTDLIIIDTEGTSDGLALSKVKPNLKSMKSLRNHFELNVKGRGKSRKEKLAQAEASSNLLNSDDEVIIIDLVSLDMDKE